MRANYRKFKLLSCMSSRVATHEAITASSGRRLYSDACGSTSKAVNKPEPEPVAVPPLMDQHGRRHNYLRISLTERCNLRCQYCMPAEGAPLSPRARLLTREELARAVRVFASLGIDKLRLTGGEPTLRADLADIIQELGALPGVRSVAMTTNGLALTRRLPALQRAGLAALNVSLDTLRADRYEQMARRPGLSRVLAGIDLALQLGYRPLKVNTVLIKGFNDDEICDFVEYTKDREVEVHRVHAVLWQRVGRQPAGAVPRGAARGGARAAGRGAGAGARARHGAAVARARARRRPGLHRLHDAALLRLLQPAAAHRRRQPEGVSVRRGGGIPAGRHARGSLRRRASTAHSSSRAQQAAETRRHAESRSDGKSTYDPHRRLAVGRPGARHYCTRAGDGGEAGDGEAGDGGEGAGEEGAGPFSHLDAEGRARMVDVSGKPVTARAALAECYLHVGPRLAALLRAGALPKGDAAAVAEVAGALAAKRTADLIPLCHPLPLAAARARVAAPDAAGRVRVSCEVRVAARTGAEMEALTGCALAALTLYDMCKSADRGMRITDLRLVRKTGGRSGDWP